MKAEKAYGCYGYVTTFNPGAETCTRCPLMKACKREAYNALKEMSGEIDVTGFIGRFADLAANDQEPIRMGRRVPKNSRQRLKQYMQTPNETLLVMSLPAKHRRLISGIHKKGIPVRNMVAAGSNPFDRYRPAFLRVPCRMLIEQGCFTRPQLKQALMREFPHWSEGTAESHASVAVGVLAALKVLKKTDNFYIKQV